MKYSFITVLFGLVVSAFPAQAQHIGFVRGQSWEAVKKMARETGKQIFVDVYTTWCAPCKKMETTVFNEPKVAAYVDKHYIALQLDAEREKAHGFFSAFKPGAYPSFYWLDKDGELLGTRTGYMPPDAFLQACKEAGQSSLGRQFAESERKWKEGNREEAFVEHFLFDLLPQIYPDSIRTYLNNYLDELSPEQLGSERTGKFLSYFTHTIRDDKTWNTLLAYNDVYAGQLDASVEFPRKMYMNLVRIPMAELPDTVKSRAFIRLIESKEFPDKPLYMRLIGMETNLFSGRFRDALSEAIAIGEAYEKTHPYVYKEMYYSFIIGKFFLETYSPSADELGMIRKLAEKAFHFSPSQATVFYLAAAHARAGDYRKAYEMLAILPFHSRPVLSNAVYSLLNISRRK